jgi:hypothetical protein
VAVNGQHSPPHLGRARHTLHVPALHSNGAPTPRALVDWIENRLVDLGGGFTRLTANGGWKDANNRTLHDELFIYFVDLEDPSPLALASIAHRVAVELGQDVVYLTVQALDVVHVQAITPSLPPKMAVALAR